MSGGEGRTLGPQDHHADRVVGFGTFEGRPKLDEHAAVLRVALLGAIERDHRDTSLVDDVVAHVLEPAVEILHGAPF